MAVNQTINRLKQTANPGQMRELIGDYTREHRDSDLQAVKADPDANISGALPEYQKATQGLDEARTVTEDQTVAGQMREILDSSSPYLTQARRQGQRMAASRGMGGSAMAAGYAQGAAIDRALPIASQDASTFADAARQYQGHLESLIQMAHQGDINAQRTLQEAGYNSQLSAQEHAQRTVEQAMAGDINSRLQLEQASQGAVLAGQQHDHERGQQKRLFGHETGMQKRQFGHETGMQSRLFSHQSGMQSREISSREQMQSREISSQQSMQQRSLENQRRMQSVDVSTRERIAQMGNDAQQRIANMNVRSGERSAAAGLAASFESDYSSVVSGIMNNPNIPAGSRQEYFDHAAQVRDNNISLVEQMYGFDLDWG